MDRRKQLLIYLVLLIIPAIFLLTPEDPPFRFKIDDNQMLVFEFKGKGFAQETLMGTEKLLSEFSFEGKFAGRATSHPSGQAISGVLERFSVTNMLEQVVIAYKKNDDGTHTYHIDPSLSPEEREGIFNFLRIDTDSKLSTDDASLFQMPLSFFIRDTLNLEEISLHPILREQLQQGLSAYNLSRIIREFLSNSGRLPPLLPKEGRPKQWITRGSFLNSLAFTSRAVSPFRENKEFTTKSSLPEGEKTTLPPWRAIRNDWELNWMFEPEAGKLHVLSGNIVLELGKELLGSLDYLAYRLEFEAVFDYPPLAPLIEAGL